MSEYSNEKKRDKNISCTFTLKVHRREMARSRFLALIAPLGFPDHLYMFEKIRSFELAKIFVGFDHYAHPRGTPSDKKILS